MPGKDAPFHAAEPKTKLLRMPHRGSIAGRLPGIPAVGPVPELTVADVVKMPPRPAGREPLRVDVVGGGPVGLTFACTLKAMMGDQVAVRIFDRRWVKAGGRVRWRDRGEGNVRREQVVTLQSNVWSGLPNKVQRALFVPGRFGEMWPLGPDSPADKGRPRNVKIRWIEDCLIDMAQDVYGIEMVAEAYTQPASWDGTHVLAIADGARSTTREGLKEHFGTPDREFYSIKGKPLEEIVLGIRVKSYIPDEHTVPLTVSQNRYLFNSLGGGFINMRLSAEEASEIVSIGENGPVECIQRYACTMRPDNGRFVCDRHKAVFKPSIDKLSFLWPRIQEGVRFFGASPQDLLGLTSFKLGMQQHSRFTAQLAPSTFGFLIGDAANSLHFWPGRGLNTGVKSAQSLAGALRERWQGKQFRSSDFAAHEGLMQQLQYREKSRAWTVMVMPDDNGLPHGIEQRVRDGLEGPFDRQALTTELWTRMRTVKNRLSSRMGNLPDDEWYLNKINGLHVKTLKIMVETGPWITREIGGDEVSVNVEFPQSALIPRSMLPGASLVG
ncbi:NAD(P)-binding protein [Umezawaea tangerina]|uniref:2-polyprenyl-6-methoxyphenol hydroxylase-like FAD-dependent oxidoreductase n=1 Tax=Umezawaea tangerina TaxID=84725 RepID=A0A2T0TL69_9PSEU|nr:NAD(P)-binding protein [Umezawaea tangerina]PRY46387.1 2-polyprenyl-6-methoxyphenol hydroxylase-like FAD-dependent oxidoreductase [Umezawaea tangerina]